MRKNRNSKLWEYLEAAGVLEKGTDTEIKAAKKAYKKIYMHGYKQRQRQTNPEFVIGFSKNNGDYETIENAAKNHNLSITSFIRYASLAYVRRTFVVPDRFQVAKLEQLLFDCLNEIKTLVHKKERFFFDREQKIEVIEKRIARLEGQIGEAFRNPPLCIHDRQNKVS